MSTGSGSGAPDESGGRAGLCDSCRNQRIVKSGRGSKFSLCELHKTDPRFPKYPRLPVRECAGYERRGR